MNVIGTVYMTGCNYQIGYDLLSQDTANNTSTLRFYGVLNVTNSYIAWSSGTASVHYTSAGLSTRYSQGSYTVVQGDYTFTHNNDGTLTINIGGNLSTTFVSGSTSGNITLPTIKRYPVLTSGSDFTDEENPTLKFTSYGTYPIRVKLEAGGNSQLITRDISDKSATSYTFDLTDEERDKLRALIPTSTMLTVREIVCAMSGNTELSSSYKDYTMSIVNGKPNFTDFNWSDVNNVTRDLTGNPQDVIMGKSTVMIEITPDQKAIAKKGASMLKYRAFSWTGTGSNYESIYIDYQEEYETYGTIIPWTANITVFAIDSRDLVQQVTKVPDKRWEYNDVNIDSTSATATRDENGVGTNATIKLNGTFTDVTWSGDRPNKLTEISYKFKKATDSDWIDGTSAISYTEEEIETSSNPKLKKFTIEAPIKSNNADYSWDLSSIYYIQVTCKDYLTEKSVTIILNKGTPELSIDSEGVGIMCGYDTSQGGLLQVGGTPVFVEIEIDE